jgi:hypothetical protein
VHLTDLAGYVPASGVGAVSLNVTVANSEGTGFVTVYACGNREAVSSVNFTAAQTVANAVISPVSAAGTVCFYASAFTESSSTSTVGYRSVKRSRRLARSAYSTPASVRATRCCVPSPPGLWHRAQSSRYR